MKRFLFGYKYLLLSCCLIIVNSSIGSIAADAQCVLHQTHRLLAEDGEAGDRFGFAVGISGTTAIVGAFTDDFNGGGSFGSAYLFDTTTGQQLFKLVPDDNDAEIFGGSVGISGTTAIVGANSGGDNGNNAGAAYLFNTMTGKETTKLLADDGASNDSFGQTVGIEGNIAIVGAPKDDDNGEDSGSAYLFHTSTFNQIAKLLPNDGAPGDHFGGNFNSSGSVAVSGSTAVVGCYRDDDNGEDSGSAYMFDTNTGQQIAKLLPDDGAALDRFGYFVGISGATAIVGAPTDDDNGVDSGSAYLFDTTTGKQIAKLLPDDGDAGNIFGRTVAISGTIAIVGAYGVDDNGENSGAAYLFDTNTGQQFAKLLADDGVEGDWLARFGIAISGTSAILGQSRASSNDIGSAYLFDVSSCVVVLGDVNLDGVVDLLDVQPFVDLLISGGFQAEADINQDGVVDLLDVQPFVDLLTG